MFESIRNVIRKAALATSNFVVREVDRERGEEKTVGARVRERAHKMGVDISTKMAISLSAQRLARFGARHLPNNLLGSAFRGLARRPMISSGVALFAFDAARDGVRFSRGSISGGELFERSSGNAVGIASSAGGAVIGGAIGSAMLPVVGSAVGSFVGGMVAGIGGDAAGRTLARRVTRQPPSATEKRTSG